MPDDDDEEVEVENEEATNGDRIDAIVEVLLLLKTTDAALTAVAERLRPQ